MTEKSPAAEGEIADVVLKAGAWKRPVDMKMCPQDGSDRSTEKCGKVLKAAKLENLERFSVTEKVGNRESSLFTSIPKPAAVFRSDRDAAAAP